MIYSLTIYANPGTQASDSALRFATALLASGHSIYRLFFYGEGVHNSSTITVTPQGEMDIPPAWRHLIETHNLDAVVCIAAALRRGILNDTEADRYDKPVANMAPEFELSGLGQWVDACVHSDRVLTFG